MTPSDKRGELDVVSYSEKLGYRNYMYLPQELKDLIAKAYRLHEREIAEAKAVDMDNAHEILMAYGKACEEEGHWSKRATTIRLDLATYYRDERTKEEQPFSDEEVSMVKARADYINDQLRKNYASKQEQPRKEETE